MFSLNLEVETQSKRESVFANKAKGTCRFDPRCRCGGQKEIELVRDEVGYRDSRNGENDYKNNLTSNNSNKMLFLSFHFGFHL